MIDRHEEDLDRVLQALRAAEPAPDMEQRVLAGLAEAEDSAVMQFGMAFGRRFAWAGVALAVVIACLAFVFLPARQVATPPVASNRPTSPAPRIAEVAPTPPAVRPRAQVYMRSSPLAEISIPVTAPMAQQAANRGLADLPSKLAPPEAETRQERLLAAIAQGPAPEQFTVLIPQRRELLARQRAADFTTFFPPQIPQEIYLATHTQN